jgi:hypothetical protein
MRGKAGSDAALPFAKISSVSRNIGGDTWGTVPLLLYFALSSLCT